MARKRSVGGRARSSSTIRSNIYIQAEKINKRIRSLHKGNNFGSYKSKDLINFARDNKYVTLSRTSRRKTPKISIINLAKATAGQVRLIGKKFKELLSAKSFTNAGINDIRKKTRIKVKTTLEGIADKELTDEDVDKFYEIVEYNKNSILEQIPPSEFYALVTQASEENLSVNGWVNLLNNYVSINNEEIREAAEQLYNKFVR